MGSEQNGTERHAHSETQTEKTFIQKQEYFLSTHYS